MAADAEAVLMAAQNLSLTVAQGLQQLLRDELTQVAANAAAVVEACYIELASRDAQVHA